MICGASVLLATALTACGSTDDTLNFGSFTDCATIGKPVVTSDPAGDQRHSSGTKDSSVPKGDLGKLTRRIHDSFGAERMIWGTLGNTAAAFQKEAARFEELLAFASEAERAAIRGGNAQRLFFS